MMTNSWTRPEHEAWYGEPGYNGGHRIELDYVEEDGTDRVRRALSWLQNDNLGEPPELLPGWYLVQYYEKSPHPESWRDGPYPLKELAQEKAMQRQAEYLKTSGRDPRFVCSNLTYIAFYLHIYRIKSESAPPHSGCRGGSLMDCVQAGGACLDDAEKYVRAAIEELGWIEEVRSISGGSASQTEKGGDRDS